MFNNAASRVRTAAAGLLGDRKTLVKILSVVLILLLALILRMHESERSDITIDSSSDAESGSELVVDIGGAVIHPGVYKVSYGTRLYEVIEAAGGLTGNADTDSVNQAAFVEDGEKIVIPEHAALENNDQYIQYLPDADGSSNNDANADDSASAASSYNAGSSGKININTATKEQLMTLSGIGDVMADRIIEYRSSSRFRNIEDIKSVKGIGDAKFSKIRDSITV